MGPQKTKYSNMRFNEPGLFVVLVLKHSVTAALSSLLLVGWNTMDKSYNQPEPGVQYRQDANRMQRVFQIDDSKNGN